MAPCDADRVHGRRIIEGFQGPALLLGGSLGRVDTTGRGGYQVLRHLEGDLGLNVSGGLGLRDITTSATPGIPQVWDHAPDNTAFDWKNGDKAIVEEASHVVELDLVKNRVVANSMERRGAIGQYDFGRIQHERALSDHMESAPA